MAEAVAQDVQVAEVVPGAQPCGDGEPIAPAPAARGLGLHQQLFLAGILPVALLGLLITVFSGFVLRQTALKLLLDRNQALTQVAAAGVGRDLENSADAITLTARTLAAGPGVSARASDVLARAETAAPQFDGGLLLLDAQGRAIATSPQHTERLGRDYTFRPYFSQVMAGAGAVFTPVVSEFPSGRPAVIIAAPVGPNSTPGGAPGEAPAGVLAGIVFLPARGWAGSLDPLAQGAQRTIYLVDNSGAVIYTPRGDPAPEISTEELARFVVAGRGQTTQLGGTIASYAPLPGGSWGLVVAEQLQPLLAATPWQWTIGGLLLIAGVLSPAIMLLSLRRATLPLVDLATAAHRVATGAAFQPIRAQGPREVRALVEVFNRMVSQQQSQQAIMEQYAAKVLQSQEEERKRLSRELHDETVQQLVALVQRIELCRSDLLRDPSAARRRLDELQRLAKEAAADVRRMSNDLRPLILEDVGLAAGVQVLCDELAVQLPSAHVHCEVVGDAVRADPDLELTLFRIVQEALSNVRKHARSAQHVGVTLYYEAWGLLATIEDDGPGFALCDENTLMQSGHLGLAGMSERARLVGGELGITSRPGSGTTITLKLPHLA